MVDEIRLVRQAQRILASAGAKVIKTHGSSLQQGEPDLYVCWPHRSLGITVVIEMKTPGNRPRPLQYHKLKQWTRSGAIAFWSDDPNELVTVIEDEIVAREQGLTTFTNYRPGGPKRPFNV